MPKLRACLESKKQRKIALVGRGSGKSTYLGFEMYASAQQMPKSLGAYFGPTYGQILTKSFPSAKKMLLSMGLKEETKTQRGHFVIGRKPPAHFPEMPYTQPEIWKYMISFFNGAAVEFISMDRPDLGRGGSYDYQLFDEATLIKKSFHDSVAMFTLRGNRRYFKHCYRHGMQVYVGTQAYSSEGYWVEDQRYLQADGGEIILNQHGEKMHDPETLFVRGSSWENIAILGEKILKRWKQTLSKPVYQVEVECKKSDKVPNSFYPAWNPKRHTYQGGLEYDYDDQSEFGIYTKRTDTDRNPKEPLIATCDFNAAQNSFLVFQEDKTASGLEIRGINEFYEDGNEPVSAWLSDFLEIYKQHGRKVLFLYGDPGGNKRNNMDNRSLYDQIQTYLQAHGWKVYVKVRGLAYPNHKEKQKFFTTLMMEIDPALPRLRVHYIRCRWLIHSIENTPINPDFTKDKRSERQDVDQRTATHGSDAFDYLLWYRYHKSARSGSTTHSPIRVGSKKV